MSVSQHISQLIQSNYTPGLWFELKIRIWHSSTSVSSLLYMDWTSGFDQWSGFNCYKTRSLIANRLLWPFSTIQYHTHFTVVLKFCPLLRSLYYITLLYVGPLFTKKARYTLHQLTSRSCHFLQICLVGGGGGGPFPTFATPFILLYT